MAIILVSQPARAKKLHCGDVFTLARYLLAEKRLAYTATAIAFKTITVQLFTQRNGQWALLAIIDPDNACVILEGADWDWAVRRRA